MTSKAAFKITVVVLLVTGALSVGMKSSYPVPASPLDGEGKRYVKLPLVPEHIVLSLKKDHSQIVESYNLEITFLGMNGQGQAQLEMNYSERNNYDGKKIGSNGQGVFCTGQYRPLINQAKTLYRTYRKCEDGNVDTTMGKNGKEIRDISSDYCSSEFTGLTSFSQQCIWNGSEFYYDENLDYGVVLLKVGETKDSFEFSITLKKSSAEEVTVEIDHLNIGGRYGPIAKTASTPMEGKQYIRSSPIPEHIELTFKKGKPEIVNAYELEIEFLGINTNQKADLDINYSKRKNYNGDHVAGLNTGWDGRSFKDAKHPVLAYPQTLYRAHRKCDSGTLLGKEIIDLGDQYRNFTGTSRFYEQCMMSGDFDTYYDEGLDYGTIPFSVNETQYADDFAIRLNNATPQEVSITILNLKQVRRYGPLPDSPAEEKK